MFLWNRLAVLPKFTRDEFINYKILDVHNTWSIICGLQIKKKEKSTCHSSTSIASYSARANLYPTYPFTFNVTSHSYNVVPNYKTS